MGAGGHDPNAHDGAVLAQPLVHHHRTQPPQQRHGLHHRARLRLPRLQRDHPVRERHPLRDAARARLQHLHGRQVAPDAEQPGDRRRALRPLAARPAASSASTASSAATRASGIPTWSTTTTRSSRRARPEEGYHLTEDLVDRSIEFIADAQADRPRQAVLPAPVLRGDARAASRRPRNGPTGTPASSTTAGTPTASRPSPGRRSSASSRPTPSCPATTRTSPTGTRCPPEARRLYTRYMEVFAGFLSHTDHHLGRLLDYLRTQGELDNTIVMVISDNGASAEGGPTGTTNEAQFFNNAQEPSRRASRSSTRSAAPTTSTTTPGAGRNAGNTPFRRWKRETYRGGASDPFIVSWPAGIKAKGEVRTQYAHIIDMVPTILDLLGGGAAGDDPGRDPVADPGRELRAHLRRRRRPRANHHTQYFEMLGHRAIYHDGWRRSAPGPARRSPRPASASGSPSPPRGCPNSTRTGWELYHVDEDFAENHNVAAENRGQAHRADRHVVRRGRQVRRHADRRQRPGADDRREADGGRCPATATRTARTRSRCRSTPRRASSTARTASPRPSRSPRAAPRACCSARAPRPAATRCSSRTASSTTSTTTSGRALYGVDVGGDRRRPATHELRFEFEPTGEPDMPHGKGAPGRLQLYVDGALVGERRGAR